MSLFLSEFMLDLSTKEKRQAVVENIGQTIKDGGTPNARIVAGPWVSLENSSVWGVLDIPDVSKTMEETAQFMVAGLLIERRLRPIANWADVPPVASKIDG